MIKFQKSSCNLEYEVVAEKAFECFGKWKLMIKRSLGKLGSENL